ncbi:MAG TPA: DNA/RNA non-specific endonuclease [Phycisphaerales bacterium]|nr:DNA/RNA non-specific endonuclease [Phycisphaerales bacterium]
MYNVLSIDGGATTKREHIFVICGPIFGSSPSVVSTGRERGIQIPESFYMILVDTEREYQTNPQTKILAYRFPQQISQNADFKDRDQFGTTVDEIERLTGLDFFPEFERRIRNWPGQESLLVREHWTLTEE